MACFFLDPTIDPNVNIKVRYKDDEDIGEYSLKMLIIIVSICSIICIVITIIVAVVWHHKKVRSRKLNNNKNKGTVLGKEKYIPVNGYTTTGV